MQNVLVVLHKVLKAVNNCEGLHVFLVDLAKENVTELGH